MLVGMSECEKGLCQYYKPGGVDVYRLQNFTHAVQNFTVHPPWMKDSEWGTTG